jgi:hypothetical protein
VYSMNEIPGSFILLLVFLFINKFILRIIVIARGLVQESMRLVRFVMLCPLRASQ